MPRSRKLKDVTIVELTSQTNEQDGGEEGISNIDKDGEASLAGENLRIDVYKWADSAGKMMIRVCLFFPLPSWSRLVDLMQETGRSISQWIHLGGVKAFSDGSLGSNSALFYEPYEDDTSNSGLQVTNLDWLLNATLESDRSGLQVAIHAIGDKANDMVLDLFNSVASLHGMRDRRFRIEHAQHLARGTAKRFGQQRVIASVQDPESSGVRCTSASSNRSTDS